MEPIEILFLIATLILIVVGFLVKEQRLNDSENSEMIFIDQLGEACKLRDGPVSAVLVRQSGNLYRELGRFDSSEAALEQILKSFRRAKIESVFLKKNTDEFSVIRLHHSYGGSANGKKLGGALIVSEVEDP